MYSFIHKSAAVQFFECAANSASGERLCREGETGDIILLNESLKFIQNVASCYALCLTKESVNTATLVHARACVCVCVCVRACVCVCHARSDTSALEIRSRGGSGFNSLPVQSPDFEKRWAIPLSAC